MIKRVRRRQHSSCDQCRKAKRACDAAFRAEDSGAEAGKLHSPAIKSPVFHGKLRLPVSRCSNCQKSGRDCTFDWLEDALPKATKSSKRRHQSRDGIEAPRRRSALQPAPLLSTYPSTLGSTSGLSLSDPGTHVWDFDPLGPGDALNGWEVPLEVFEEEEVQQLAGLEDFTGHLQIDDKIIQGNVRSKLDHVTLDPQVGWWTDDDPVSNSVDNLQVLEHWGMDLDELEYPCNEQGLVFTAPWNPERESTLPFTDSDSASLPRIPEDQLSSSWLSGDSLSFGTNRWLLTQNWLRVYHDSFENALSCWLTERNCPYTLARNAIRDRGRSSSLPADGYSGIWGPHWSNRIYTRVCNLDRFSNSLPGKQLTSSESSRAGKALNAAVMAFGVQWAQSGARGNVRDHFASSSFVPGVYEEMNLPAADEFGRSMQETLWNQARQALQDAAGIQSYRVAFANIIFSLTQRPLNFDDWSQSISWKPRYKKRKVASHPESDTTTPFMDDETSGSQNNKVDSMWDALQEIISADGPPIFLEAALRQLISSRWKWEQYGRQQAKSLKKETMSGIDQASTARGALSQEHRETFKLLSWLAIMFDTISSAMLQRPLVVSDEDSTIDTSDPWETPSELNLHNDNGGLNSPFLSIDLDGWDPALMKPDIPKDSHSTDIWGTLFLKSDAPQRLQDRNDDQWPFSLEEAASILCDAAPVKVLLFRKVGHIQKLMSRRSGSEALEAAIEKALGVYTFWNRTYGRFIAQCIAKHHHLPARIQSWYLVLAGHWHLGTILLADVVEDMDEAGLSQPSQRDMRRMSDFSNDMRRKNATTISELCRCSLHGPSLTFPRAREFTYPVNQVALLSEPWTVVLIQSFSRAGYVFVSQLNSPRKWRNRGWSSRDDEISLAKRRCSYCIEGLLNLGNKSDMAYLAAKFLQDCLRGLNGEGGD